MQCQLLKFNFVSERWGLRSRPPKKHQTKRKLEIVQTIELQQYGGLKKNKKKQMEWLNLMLQPVMKTKI